MLINYECCTIHLLQSPYTQRATSVLAVVYLLPVLITTGIWEVQKETKNKIAASPVHATFVIVSVAVDVLGDTMTVMATSVASHNDAMQL